MFRVLEVKIVFLIKHQNNIRRSNRTSIMPIQKKKKKWTSNSIIVNKKVRYTIEYGYYIYYLYSIVILR